MIKRQDIEARLAERPFRPFRLHASGGRVHEIRHPELVWVMVNKVFIAVKSAASFDTRAIDDYVVLSMLHLTEIEPVGSPPEAAPPASNGEVPAQT